MTKTFLSTLDLNNPYLIAMNEVENFHDFIQIFTGKTVLDIIGEALELHFNNDLNEDSLSDCIENILVNLHLTNIRMTMQYIPYTKLLVFDKTTCILSFNFSKFVNKLYWQIQSLVAQCLIAPLRLQYNECVTIENVRATGVELTFTIKVTDMTDRRINHAPVSANVGFF